MPRLAEASLRREFIDMHMRKFAGNLLSCSFCLSHHFGDLFEVAMLVAHAAEELCEAVASAGAGPRLMHDLDVRLIRPHI